jgi:hypothetical protein
MQIGVSTHPARRWSLLALVALLGLAVTFAATSASGASSGHAVAAKKKCKKKHKSAATAKKKKCKKKKKAIVPPATPPSTPTAPSGGPTVRASVTWDSTDEVDLHVFDALGNTDFYSDSNSTIPDADVDDQDEELDIPETFTDFQSPSTRAFTFWVCLYGDDEPTDPVHVTVDITDPGGGHRSVPVTLDGEEDEEFVTVSPLSAPAFAPEQPFCYDASPL